MDFAIPEEYIHFRNSVYQFAKDRIAPRAEELDLKGEFGWQNWRDMAQMGLLGLPFPEEYGGSNASPLATCLAMEAMAHAGVDSGTTLSWGAHTILCGVPIWLLGTAEQKQKYLPKIASGEWIGGFGLTEPDAGSDAASLKTTAVKQGDRWVLNGSKMFITNGPIGHVFVVFASTDKSQGNKGISAFIVEKGFPGFSVGKELKKMGNRTSPTSELVFDNCEVPEENLLGPLHRGFLAVGKETLEWERSCMIAPIVGGMEFLLEQCVEYAKNRRQFGQPIANFQAIQHKLADMKVALEASRLLIYRVAWMKERGQSAMLEASIAKLFVTEQMLKVANDAVQIFGGYGYIHEYPVERAYRDAKLGTLGAGTSEVQKMVIISELLKRYVNRV
ncbi:MAG: acyl-CoA dehydrogenase family protein [Acidobacteriota bacterium]|nr:acyl-CoA dehydrogenase family protein [Blastocatellia bacterium]MDW8239011.1 acyl-CoA dehydrogenase family protein [Acidobacteriota bacterium]